VTDPSPSLQGIAHDWGAQAPSRAPSAATSWRSGGVSEVPYASLNVGLRVGDTPAAVVENRRRFLMSWGAVPDSLVVPGQVHGVAVGVVTPDEREFPDTDALITTSNEIALGVIVADCVPIYFWDPVRGTIGIAHSGWRGTAARIASRTLLSMCREFGSRAHDCRAILGPSIGPCCYEVSQELADGFRASFGDEVADGRHLDLWRAIRNDLIAAGMRSDRIVVSGLCTHCRRELFYSHRRDGPRTGRHLAAIRLP